MEQELEKLQEQMNTEIKAIKEKYNQLKKEVKAKYMERQISEGSKPIKLFEKHDKYSGMSKEDIINRDKPENKITFQVKKILDEKSITNYHKYNILPYKDKISIFYKVKSNIKNGEVYKGRSDHDIKICIENAVQRIFGVKLEEQIIQKGWELRRCKIENIIHINENNYAAGNNKIFIMETGSRSKPYAQKEQIIVKSIKVHKEGTYVVHLLYDQYENKFIEDPEQPYYYNAEKEWKKKGKPDCQSWQIRARKHNYNRLATRCIEIKM